MALSALAAAFGFVQAIAYCALQRDGTHATADVDEFVHFDEGRLKDDGVCGFVRKPTQGI